MKLILLHFISLICCCLLSIGQTRQSDTTQSFNNAYAGTLNIIPAYYSDICKKLQLSLVDKSLDSFSVRLWMSSMMGYELITLTQRGNGWESIKYQY